MTDLAAPGTRLARLESLGKEGRAGKIPFVAQLTATDCGAACLTMVLAMHGKEVRLDDVRDVLGSGRDGVTAHTILGGARWYGLRGRGVKVLPEDFDCLPAGSILHWEFNHFVVFERLTRDGIVVVDPALGRRSIPLAQLRKSFTGIALVLEPSETFDRATLPATKTQRYKKWLFSVRGYWPRILTMTLLLQMLGLATPVLTGAIVDRVVPRGDQHLLLVLVVGIVSLLCFQFLSVFLRSQFLLELRMLVDVKMSLGFVEHLVSLPYAFFQRRSAGDLMTRLNSNGQIREILTSGALTGALDGMLVCLYLCVLFFMDVRMGALTVAFAAVQVASFTFASSRIREQMTQELAAQSKLQSYQIEMLAGMETLKMMGAEMRAVDRWSDQFFDVLNASLARGRLSSRFEALNSTVKLGGPLLVMCAGAAMVLEGSLSLGAMLTLNALAMGFLGPLSNLVASGMQLQLLGSYMHRLEDVLDAPPERATPGQRVSRLDGRITLERVSFRYGPLAPLVVDDVSVQIEPGQSVAIVGKSGSGKSTVASLLAGLYEPTSGRILYDGQDLTTLDPTSLRRHLGVVTQKPYLFGGSMRDNIALADPTLGLEEVVLAARKAKINRDIVDMPMQYDTVLLDGGASLSGGQRQRLALARALATSPAILLLDEATSALDTITETRVQKELEALSCTRIVIAHRLCTVAAADVILVMDQGRIVQRGTHSQLLLQGGIYAELAAAQYGEQAAPQNDNAPITERLPVLRSVGT